MNVKTYEENKKIGDQYPVIAKFSMDVKGSS